MKEQQRKQETAPNFRPAKRGVSEIPFNRRLLSRRKGKHLAWLEKNLIAYGVPPEQVSRFACAAWPLEQCIEEYRNSESQRNFL